jgi:hypothetical protein
VVASERDTQVSSLKVKFESLIDVKIVGGVEEWLT